MFIYSAILVAVLSPCSAISDVSKSQVTIESPALTVILVPVNSLSNFHYEIRLRSATELVQTLKFRNGVQLDIGDVQLVDLNGDGYKDLMVWGGTDAARDKWYKTWLYNPKTKLYVWVGKAIE